MSNTNDLKSIAGFGKEWYAVKAGFSPVSTSNLIEFIEAKAKELYPALMTRQPYDVDLFWAVYGASQSVMRHDEGFGLYLVHKKTFKRILKKAIMKSFRKY